MDHVDEYWLAVRRKVCEKCVDGDGIGNCRLTPGHACALQKHLPQVVRAILTVKSTEVQPYVEALRLDACAVCEHQALDGACALRNQLDCGLDRYFPLVIEAIEQVHLELRKTTEGPGD